MIVSCNHDNSLSSSGTNKLNKFIAPASSDSINLNDTISIAFQDTLCNKYENICLSFDSIGVESRCPINVVCIWEGNAEISLAFTKDGLTTKFVLNTHPSFVTDTVLYNYNIELIDILPYPHTDSLYSEYDYSAKLNISK